MPEPTKMEILKLQQADSTNSWVSENWDSLSKPSFVVAVSQIKGRGQRGNSWESENGKNLTGTFAFVAKGILPQEQFLISEAVSLAVVDTLADFGIDVKVKWPNDIYWNDKKICGILIENTILGKEITRTIAGIGLNINQKEFLSDAPNPVSMAQITGSEFNIDEVALTLCGKLLGRISQTGDADSLAEAYRNILWRGDGRFYPFYNKKNGTRFRGRLKKVGREGLLTIETREGAGEEFAFKEVEFVL